MLDDRTLFLINAGIDGELSAEEQAELERILAESQEARTMQAEFLRLANLMDSQPEIQPPAGLQQQIVDRLAPQPAVPAFSLWKFMTSMQPATAGAAFAAGLLATVAFYEWAPGQATTHDVERMVGTMVAGQTGRPAKILDSLQVAESGLNGQLELRHSGGIYQIDFDLTSADPVEVEITFAEAGLSFGGFAHTRLDVETNSDSFELSGGTLRVENHGRQAFTLFLPVSVEEIGSVGEIHISISAEGAQLYSGALNS